MVLGFWTGDRSIFGFLMKMCWCWIWIDFDRFGEEGGFWIDLGLAGSGGNAKSDSFWVGGNGILLGSISIVLLVFAILI